MDKKNNTLKLAVTVRGCPESADEFDKLAGKAGAALMEAVNNVIWRKWNPEFRSKLIERLTPEFGALQNKLDKSGNPVQIGTDEESGEAIYAKETEKDYVDRIQAEGKVSKADLQVIAQEVADKIPFDPSTSESTPAKKFVDAAENVLARVKAGEKSISDIVAKLKGRNAGMILSDNPDVNELAAALRDDEARAIAENEL